MSTEEQQILIQFGVNQSQKKFTDRVYQRIIDLSTNTLTAEGQTLVQELSINPKDVILKPFD